MEKKKIEEKKNETPHNSKLFERLVSFAAEFDRRNESPL